MAQEVEERTAVHGGRLVAQAMKSRGASKLFTLSGGHLFYPLLLTGRREGCAGIVVCGLEVAELAFDP